MKAAGYRQLRVMARGHLTENFEAAGLREEAIAIDLVHPTFEEWPHAHRCERLIGRPYLPRPP